MKKLIVIAVAFVIVVMLVSYIIETIETRFERYQARFQEVREGIIQDVLYVSNDQLEVFWFFNTSRFSFEIFGYNITDQKQNFLLPFRGAAMSEISWSEREEKEGDLFETREYSTSERPFLSVTLEPGGYFHFVCPVDFFFSNGACLPIEAGLPVGFFKRNREYIVKTFYNGVEASGSFRLGEAFRIRKYPFCVYDTFYYCVDASGSMTLVKVLNFKKDAWEDRDIELYR